jgi:hypothetical protein
MLGAARRGERAGPNIHNGDISIPVEKIEPPLYLSRRPAGAAKKARKTELFNAFDEYRNYQNSLRLKSAYDTRCGNRPAPARPSFAPPRLHLSARTRPQ